MITPVGLEDTVSSELHKYGLLTKPSEPLLTARGPSLQLTPTDHGIAWRHRADASFVIDCPYFILLDSDKLWTTYNGVSQLMLKGMLCELSPVQIV